ncbi:hypothetical protein OJF2_34050 [Aquisphaera giovannonii]|uniref:Uncharacterized protein n=1 Tax=Aquisphaera giovannonii TaxID=406548 RepID=A0A5B9W4E5_9BACT|nr:hypothetical protein [Aquisphaera giovannonii]QEH34860.1 hypothetical protein OJF2_34050 [Aquisphaera giovannonii]
MKIPRMGVAGLLFGIALLAIDMASVEVMSREMSLRYSWEFQVLLGALPLLNALAIGLYLLARRLATRGVAGPFLVGFQATGWLSFAALLVAKLGFSDPMNDFNEWATDALEMVWREWIMWTGEFTYRHTESLRAVIRVLVVTGPPLLAALLGAWCMARLGLTVVRVPAPGGLRRAIPARRAAAIAAVAGLLLLAGVWGAKVRGRWVIYRRTADGAAYRIIRYPKQRAETLARIRELDRHSEDFAEEPERFASYRESLVRSAEDDLRELERAEFERKVYEPAARRPWLPIPPNPPLDPSELEGGR